MIVLLGASCSGKTTLFNSLCEQSIWNKRPDIVCVKEYTTRPPRHPDRNNPDDDRYYFVTEEEYFELLHSSKLATNFEVEVHNSFWYYGIHKDDIRHENVISTNPTSFSQLQKYTEDLCSIYLNVGQRERLIRMLNRGDNISEAYRRSVHDEGHFSGIRKKVNHVVDSAGREDMLTQSMKIIEEYLMEDVL